MQAAILDTDATISAASGQQARADATGRALIALASTLPRGRPSRPRSAGRRAAGRTGPTANRPFADSALPARTWRPRPPARRACRRLDANRAHPPFSTRGARCGRRSTPGAASGRGSRCDMGVKAPGPYANTTEDLCSRDVTRPPGPAPRNVDTTEHALPPIASVAVGDPRAAHPAGIAAHRSLLRSRSCPEPRVRKRATSVASWVSPQVPFYATPSRPCVRLQDARPITTGSGRGSTVVRRRRSGGRASPSATVARALGDAAGWCQSVPRWPPDSHRPLLNGSTTASSCY